MIPFPQYIRLTFVLSFVLLFASLVLWFSLPSYRPHSAGFMLGLVASILNGIILAIKTVRISEYALGQIKKKQGTGLFQRFLLAGFAGYVAIKLPAYFNVVWVLIGISTVTILSFFVAILHYFTKKAAAERGEQ